MSSMGSPDGDDRRLLLVRGVPADLLLVRLARPTLIVSLLILAVAPLLIGDSYSVTEHTLSESGAQGIEGAWVLRTGVLLTSFSVLAMALTARSVWGRAARWWLRIYALALVMLVVFPEAPWDGSAHSRIVASIHTVFGATGAIAFIFGVMAVSASRPRSQLRARVFDWVAIAAVALIPQIMLLVTNDGLWQRFTVVLGYVWLISEASRVPKPPLVSRPSLRAKSEPSRLADRPPQR